MRATTLACALGLAACQSSSKPDPGAAASAHAVERAPTATPTPVEKPVSAQPTADLASLWDIPLQTLDGKPTTLGAFRGKELLVVNVASKCGLTPQYKQLEQLQETYAARGFTVVGFPCNQFGGQEPGSAEQIQEFCSTTYGVTFPMMAKNDVNGAGRQAVYKLLTPIADDTGHTGDIRWNFEKFVISADGTRVTRFAPKTKPDDAAVIAAIEAGLPKT